MASGQLWSKVVWAHSGKKKVDRGRGDRDRRKIRVLIPADFIAPIHSLNEVGLHHDILLANVIAQSEALMKGKTEQEVIAEGVSEELIPFGSSSYSHYQSVFNY